MAEKLVLKTDKEPTYFNKDLAIGALAAALLPIPGLNLLSGALVVGAGAAVGGMIGERRMEREAIMGKKVGEPSLINKDTLLGGLAGAVGGLFTGAFAMVAGAAIALSIPAVAPAAAAIALTAGIATGAATFAAGTYIGAKAGETRMAREYKEAKEQNLVNDISKNVSPQVAGAVEYAMENDKTKDWAKHIENERAHVRQHEQHR